mmetsp:Transcript_100609/g.285044  ORF Transcript_100609/g.285044 Transcript_100609/m.285044 type:complete len:214 (-) Transcript_100609:1581-2222(-)
MAASAVAHQSRSRATQQMLRLGSSGSQDLHGTSASCVTASMRSVLWTWSWSPGLSCRRASWRSTSAQRHKCGFWSSARRQVLSRHSGCDCGRPHWQRSSLQEKQTSGLLQRFCPFWSGRMHWRKCARVGLGTRSMLRASTQTKRPGALPSLHGLLRASGAGHRRMPPGHGMASGLQCGVPEHLPHVQSWLQAEATLPRANFSAAVQPAAWPAG